MSAALDVAIEPKTPTARAAAASPATTSRRIERGFMLQLL
jgi:hypothetical protein